jgi:RNA polymerase sigma-70 factor (ECF subfamily)
LTQPASPVEERGGASSVERRALERRLLSEAKAGSRQAFGELVRLHQRRAFAVALGVVHDPDDARDVCQEAFLKAHRNLANFEGDAQFFTWLYRIVMNLCIDHLRRRRGEKVEFDEAIASEEPTDDSGLAPQRLGFDPGKALTNRELRERIQAALGQLSATHRTVLVMREVEGLAYQEMADRMDCSIGTIMSRLFHARKRMQKLLEEYRTDDAAYSRGM